MISKKIISCFACLFIFVQFCLSQGKTDGLPITVQVNTSVNLSNGSVELSGVSNRLDGASKPKVQLTNGKFSVVYNTKKAY